jgi:hypothetical protein
MLVYLSELCVDGVFELGDRDIFGMLVRKVEIDGGLSLGRDGDCDHVGW